MYNWGVLAYERVVGKVGSALSFYLGSLRQRVYLLSGWGFGDGGLYNFLVGVFQLFGRGYAAFF